MKYLILYICILLLQDTNAQDWEKSFKSDFPIQSMVTVGSDTIITIGGIHINYTFDKGNTWHNKLIDSNIISKGLTYTSDGCCWVWGKDKRLKFNNYQLLVMSKDFGKTWRRVIYTEERSQFLAPALFEGVIYDSLNALFFIRDSLFKTNDGFKTLTYLNLNTNTTVYYKFDSTTWHTVNDFGKMHISTDKGNSWHSSVLFTDSVGIFQPNIYIRDTNNIYFSDHVNLLYTKNKGATWLKINSNRQFLNITSLRVQHDTIFILDNKRKIYSIGINDSLFY